MASAQDEPADLIDDASTRIADLAKVPLERRVDFCEALPGLFKLARTWHEWDVTSAPKRDAIDRQLKRLEKDATAFKARLEGLDDAARETLGIYALCHELFGAAATDEQLRFQVMDIVEGGQAKIGLSRVGLLKPIKNHVSLKAHAILAWLAEIHHPLKRLTFIVEGVPPDQFRVYLLRADSEYPMPEYNWVPEFVRHSVR